MKQKEILLQTTSDRRLFPNIPAIHGRKQLDRRVFATDKKQQNAASVATRYLMNNTASIVYRTAKRKKVRTKATIINASVSGMLLEIALDFTFPICSDVKLRFEVEQGSMPEGTEGKVKMRASVVRTHIENGKYYLAVQFKENLLRYTKKRRGTVSLWSASILLFFVTFVILLMRAESIIFFSYNKLLYFYSLIAAGFLLSRYLFGFFYRPKPIDTTFTPSVSIVIPCFNEEEWIQRTILNCLDQNYPADCLEVIVVDDCSNDKSVEMILEIIEKIKRSDPEIGKRVSFFPQETNKGKRHALVKGANLAKHEMVVFVDSDSFLEPDAILHLVQPMKDPWMGGVSGRTDVANKYTNVLTKMQGVRYYIAFRIMKAAESIFDAVTCLSGPLACYRKALILAYEDDWLNQKFLGQPATFGDDRSMTNFILRHARTSYQDTAVCSTIVPSSYSQFIKQQMRWKRSWLRESIIAATFMWKKEIMMSLSFYMGLIVPIAAPVVVLYNLLYVPWTMGIFPTTFLVGLLLMAMMMSVTNLFFMKSSLWMYGLWFCLFYEAVLLWQMPIAWLTFWKSTWGTRLTPQDIEASQHKQRRKKHPSGEEINQANGFVNIKKSG